MDFQPFLIASLPTQQCHSFDTPSHATNCFAGRWERILMNNYAGNDRHGPILFIYLGETVHDWKLRIFDEDPEINEPLARSCYEFRLYRVTVPFVFLVRFHIIYSIYYQSSLWFLCAGELWARNSLQRPRVFACCRFWARILPRVRKRWSLDFCVKLLLSLFNSFDMSDTEDPNLSNCLNCAPSGVDNVLLLSTRSHLPTPVPLLLIVLAKFLWLSSSCDITFSWCYFGSSKCFGILCQFPLNIFLPLKQGKGIA